MKSYIGALVKKNIILIATLFIALFVAGDISASSHEDAKNEVKEAAQAIKEYTIEQKNEAIANAQELMEEFDDSMHVWEGRMKEKWDDLKDTSKDKYEASKQSIDKQRKELSIWFDKMQDSSADAWEEIKNGFSDAYDSLQQEWKKIDNEG